jgi:hypothetical protein
MWPQGHALLWSGSADSCVDLNTFLPAGFVTSEATGIDEQGCITGTAFDEGGRYHAVMWVPIPEPTTLSLLAVGGMAMLRRKK